MYARHVFSSRGKGIQAKVHGLVLDRIMDWDRTGKVLDIGCGNGPLTIQIAKKYPQARVHGIDYWGKAWEYSKRACERNAEIEKVAERVTFEKANAASLPFDDGAFDGAVSNLVFHEVRSAKDKRMVIKEALRVVKKGGWFVFQDLFFWKSIYGETDDLIETIRGWGIEKVELESTVDSGLIPKVLRLPFMLGTAGILYGKK
jgi:ubiquinone/menaquinone biosynthesis C-methylase UbiE